MNPKLGVLRFQAESRLKHWWIRLLEVGDLSYKAEGYQRELHSRSRVQLLI